MQHTWKVVLFSSLFLPLSMKAVEKDTAKTYQAEEVVVTATRSAISPHDAVAPVQLISFDQLQQIGGNTAADVLKMVNGVHLNEYGSEGAIKMLSFRGMSAENVLVMVNGNPINNPQNGSIDLSLLPLDYIGQMEIFRGGISALYGADASGGVVNIITRKASEKLQMRAYREWGSYGTQKTLGEVQGRIAGIGILGGASKEFGFDDYSFRYHRLNQPDTTMNRHNNDFLRTQVYGNFDYQINDFLKFNSSIQYIDFVRGVPGSLSYATETARQQDETYRATFSSEFIPIEALTISSSAVYSKNNEEYREPFDFSIFHSEQVTLNSIISWSASAANKIIGGIEYAQGELKGNGVCWGTQFLLNPLRTQKSVFLSHLYTYQREAKWFDRILLTQAIRVDYFSDIYNEAWSPNFGVNLRVNKLYNMHVRSSWGKNFRVPTFNDKYSIWGNPNLHPEYSSTIDVGIISNLDNLGYHTIEATYFMISLKDKIMYSADFHSYNIGKSENTGLEIRYDYHSLDNTFNVCTGLTFMDAIDKTSLNDPAYGKQLPHIPNYKGTFGFSLENEIGRINLQHIIVGERYSNKDNSESISAYNLIDVTLTKNIDIGMVQITLRGIAKNVFGMDYQVIEGYPMPGRTFQLSAEIDY